ncbi:MAG: tetratricopeptide repeat protein [Okeania sp. SIO3I5]|uniref:tetratricopeptide repeat protein n=1 Tax=Okeania sp. SIO3I5 TaxID=2607805 RepID=UPI0013B98E9A|nr:tetratricopeptide repeat protein [Okeania sp. SIO3I5]NEQ35830.1 tetratricopeptide repeat protein [Okeania sp. SIO3I5]
MLTDTKTDTTTQNMQESKYAKTHYRLGQISAKQGKLEEAITCYNTAIEINPYFTEAYYSLANILVNQNQLEAAASLCQKLIKIQPNLWQAHHNLGEILIKQEKFSEAILAYRHAIELNQNSYLSYFKLAEILVKVRQFSQAINAYRKAIALDPNFADAYQYLGDVLVETDQKEEAIKVYRKAVEIKPQLWDVHHKLGNLLQEKEELEAAVAAYNKSIEFKPDFSWSYNNLGDVFVSLEQWDKAAKVYDRATKLNPDFAWGYYKLGDVLVNLEQWKEAIAAYRQAVAINSQAPWYLYKLGALLHQQGEFEEAVGYLREAVKLKTDASEFYLGLGAVLVKLKQWLEAEKYLQEAIATTDSFDTSHSAAAYYYLGVAKSEQQQWLQAVEFYRRSLEINPDGGDCCLALAEAFGKLEKWSEAVEFYRRAVLLSGKSNQVLFRLGEALGQLQNWAKNVNLSPELDVKKEEIADSQAEISSFQKVVTQEPEIILFTPYYKAKHSKRQEELIYCLKKNTQCDEIAKIILVIDDDHIPEVESSKIEIVKVSARPTYLDWVELTEQKCQNQISILANTDIYFDESIARIREIFAADPQGFVALSRYEKEAENQTLHKTPHWSQDVWAVSGNFKFTTSFKNSLRVSLGVPRCDNKIAYLFAIHGAPVYNPCHHIKTVHVQESQLRYYDKYGDTSILGGTAWVYPSIIINEPSKIQIDLWTLNSSNLAGLQVNKTWDSLNKKSQKEESKESDTNDKEKSSEKKIIHNVLGFDSDWQYPAITEKYAYQMANKFLTKDNFEQNVIYFGFPWATLLDKRLHSQDKTEANALIEKLNSFQDELKKYKKVITVCQHIRMLEFEGIFDAVGITDIFWSHTKKDQNVLPSYPHISLHSFPLYPVQAIDIEAKKTDKKYLYSFVGTRPSKSYLTDSRTKIIDSLSDDNRGLIIARNQWHYNKIVYDRQILKKVKNDDNLVDNSASEEFKQVMQESVFALCPSGSGPNSIRLWEAIGLGAIPVVIADTYLPPGDRSLWDEATVTCSEKLEDIKALPDRLAEIQKDDALLHKKREALKQLWTRYGADCFVYDIEKLFFQYASGKLGATKPKTKASKGLKKAVSLLAPKKLTKEDFKPSYTWPNPTFPFRLYYDGAKCRIFIIENIQHNWKWMAECHERFRKTDFFFVMTGWYQSPTFADEAEAIFSVLKLDKKQFFFMYNSPQEMENFAKKGFQGDVINQNAWLDEKAIAQHLDKEKIYDGIYVDFNKKSKRPQLADRVYPLALVTKSNHGKAFADTPPYKFLNEQQLSPTEMWEKINQSHCGLVLSAEEGACQTSSEYLLCGIPVVSTSSLGGRDVWYNEHNSIICEATPEAVASAVEKFVKNPPDAQRIRQQHIEQAKEYREKFIQVVADVFKQFGVIDVEASSYFQKNFYNKMRKNENIKFVKSLFV